LIRKFKHMSKIEFLAPTKIIVNHSNVEGRGVFATEDIREGEIVERCPMIRLEHRSTYQHDPTIWKYCYTQPKCDCADCKNHGFYFWAVLGYGMIYNHQDIPNTKWSFNYKESYADVVSVSDIKKDTEIFVTYGSSYFKGRNKVTVNSQPEPILAPEEKKLLIELEKEEDDNTFLSKIHNWMNPKT